MNFKDNSITDRLSAAPKPFPGRHPTRLIVRASYRSADGPIRALEYKGKPSPHLGPFLIREHFRKGGSVGGLSVSEVDQNGLVRQYSGMGGRMSSPFADTYFAIPASTAGYLSPFGRFMLLLHRQPVIVDGERTYTSPFLDDSPWKEQMDRMARDCVNLRLTRHWFSEAEQIDMAAWLEAGPFKELHSKCFPELAGTRILPNEGQAVRNRFFGINPAAVNGAMRQVNAGGRLRPVYLDHPPLPVEIPPPTGEMLRLNPEEQIPPPPPPVAIDHGNVHFENPPTATQEMPTITYTAPVAPNWATYQAAYQQVTMAEGLGNRLIGTLRNRDNPWG